MSDIAVWDAIRMQREILGLSHAEFAKKIGVSRTTAYRLERPGCNPRLRTFHKITQLDSKRWGFCAKEALQHDHLHVVAAQATPLTEEKHGDGHKG